MIFFSVWGLSLLSVFTVSLSDATQTSSYARRTMGWLCLEFCDNSTVIDIALNEISRHLDVITAVSFEKYQLGANATLITANVTDVVGTLQHMGIQETWPMLTSYPHPPEFIEWMRDAFTNVDKFTAQCVEEAQKYNYTGYNLDWEPTDGVMESDAALYTQFIEDFAQGLHAHGIQLQVCVANWGSPSIWDYAGIAGTSADYFLTMGTYTSNDASFSTQLSTAVTSFGVDRLGVGLMVVNASTDGHIPMNEVQWRFDEIVTAGVNEIDFWRFPVPAAWWPLINDFMK